MGEKGKNQIKIVVAGPYAAGKTQFINTVSEIQTVQTEAKTTKSDEKTVKNHTTVAMDFGRITIDDNHVLYLFGTPGQERFDFMWDILGKGMVGLVVLVDSTDPSTFHEARKIINYFESRYPAPFVVGCNKQDLKGAWDPQDIRIALDLNDDVKVLPLVALSKESVKNILLELLEEIAKHI
ncbi:MAG TPA: GTP-binding protein [Persephonella sp.]|uniref:Small GTP-binding protein n=1 Tax=Persephonella marina (strain DSM 14350 / EX-H1) TaxID=123214 RepID=C0QS53_PERMH|nr:MULTISPECIES: ATP/GTP-binding protein [Persephonella]ACO04099.1 small GTP-binding protein [Persephonella marina EX-H1]HCB69243.1 GTP-binding protein [Persephonella sp.]